MTETFEKMVSFLKGKISYLLFQVPLKDNPIHQHHLMILTELEMKLRNITANNAAAVNAQIHKNGEKF